MQKVLRTEIKKAIMTRYFIISIAIGILISMLGLVYNVGLFCGNQRYDGMNPCYEAFTLFNHWIGGEGFSLGSSFRWTYHGSPADYEFYAYSIVCSRDKAGSYI